MQGLHPAACAAAGYGCSPAGPERVRADLAHPAADRRGSADVPEEQPLLRAGHVQGHQTQEQVQPARAAAHGRPLPRAGPAEALQRTCPYRAVRAGPAPGPGGRAPALPQDPEAPEPLCGPAPEHAQAACTARFRAPQVRAAPVRADAGAAGQQQGVEASVCAGGQAQHVCHAHGPHARHPGGSDHAAALQCARERRAARHEVGAVCAARGRGGARPHTAALLSEAQHAADGGADGGHAQAQRAGCAA
mmetsp:Transcript_1501/g.3316  ORF Transcript_1501/g.3316 Transcript_1501/m.3316 type:complete len:248 (+) Transcript_1501:301-1044(+)